MSECFYCEDGGKEKEFNDRDLQVKLFYDLLKQKSEISRKMCCKAE